MSVNVKLAALLIKKPIKENQTVVYSNHIVMKRGGGELIRLIIPRLLIYTTRLEIQKS